MVSVSSSGPRRGRKEKTERCSDRSISALFQFKRRSTSASRRIGREAGVQPKTEEERRKKKKEKEKYLATTLHIQHSFFNTLSTAGSRVAWRDLCGASFSSESSPSTGIHSLHSFSFILSSAHLASHVVRCTGAASRYFYCPRCETRAAVGGRALFCVPAPLHVHPVLLCPAADVLCARAESLRHKISYSCLEDLLSHSHGVLFSIIFIVAFFGLFCTPSAHPSARRLHILAAPCVLLVSNTGESIVLSVSFTPLHSPACLAFY